MTQDCVVEIKDLWFSYRDDTVLKDVNLKIFAGEIACIVGPNGGGKTTLLKLMLGLLAPDRGEIRVLGGSPADARTRIGYAPQHTNFDAKFPINALEVVLMGRLGKAGLLGRYGREDREAAAESLAGVGLSGFERKPFSELSGGQRQRILIARALASKPSLLLLDEPTSSLDVAAEREFYNSLTRMRDRMTVVMVSHDIGFVSESVGKVICVHNTVAVHPTADLTGELMLELYGRDVRLIRHDHDCQRECAEGDRE